MGGYIIDKYMQHINGHTTSPFWYMTCQYHIIIYINIVKLDTVPLPACTPHRLQTDKHFNDVKELGPFTRRIINKFEQTFKY